MAAIGDALRQAFMPRREYESLRNEDRALPRLRRPLLLSLAGALSFAVVVSVSVSLSIVFPGDPNRRPFCGERRIHMLPLNASEEADGYGYHGAFYLTDEEAADYYWIVVFVPSAILFFFSVAYLFSGVAVAYTAPRRHPCLKVVENSYCASKRGGVRCLAILNVVFAVIFGLMALFLGSSLLSLGSSCSIPLFWCYEIASWSLVILFGGTAFFLRRNAASILDGGDFSAHNLALEMSESIPEVTPAVERRVNEGFKSWMGSSLLSSDEEDGPDDYLEEGRPILTNPVPRGG
ncbi:uncharacterized protein M6B38_158715 [Iris pallida]|uniref:Uncharacterized protein n=1 Tax=Iris pallida TaxID=29817 RepID=A0AAX6F286_IRIPA|nr:uncharacterized protein M6B38_158715 [Iris pallida]